MSNSCSGLRRSMSENSPVYSQEALLSLSHSSTLPWGCQGGQGTSVAKAHVPEGVKQ